MNQVDEADRLTIPADFVVCVDNSDYPVSLDRYKIYQVTPDAEARAAGEIRIVDESGEDYLYSKERFVSIRPPAAARESLVCA